MCSVARTLQSPKANPWRTGLEQALRTPLELLEFCRIDPDQVDLLTEPAFPMLVPRPFASRISPGNARDPLLLQVLARAQEAHPAQGFGTDPVGDHDRRRGSGVIHKYHGRVLLITTGACAIHCRYCFRQHYPYTQDTAMRGRWQGALDYLSERPEVTELILSGGDPLMLDTRHLRVLTEELVQSTAIRRLRLHTRLPIALPDRVDDELIEWLGSLPWPVVIVIHANHPAEFDQAVDHALGRLRSAGVHLLNQAVMLAGINDQPEALESLMARGFAAGVLPYYLHLLDRVAGAGHFETSETRAAELMEQLRIRLPGYLVPRLVREQAGAPYKLPIL